MIDCSVCNNKPDVVNHNNRGWRCTTCWKLVALDEIVSEPDFIEPEIETELDLSDMTISEVLDLVSSGSVSAVKAKEAEEKGKNRVTLIRQLDQLITS